MMIKSKLAMAGLASALAVAPMGAAQAGVVIPAVFNFTVGSNTGIADGNARFFSAVSPTYGTFNVRATGWSLEVVNGVTYIRDSKLMVYGGGLGVISGDDDGGASNQHTIDNSERRDFVVLQFNRRVEFERATFNTYSVSNLAKDSDATFMYGDTDIAWNSVLALDGQQMSALNSLFSGSFLSLSPAGANGASNTRNINPDNFTGDIWLVGSGFTNSDRKIDGFKFTNLAVIPEPSTWAMLIAGFGLVGASMRRRGRTQTVAA